MHFWRFRHKLDHSRTMIKDDKDILNDTRQLAACGQHAVKCQRHLRCFSKSQIRQLHTQIVYILNLRLAGLKKNTHTGRTIHWRERSKRITLCSRGYFRRVFFSTLKITEARKKVKKLGITWKRWSTLSWVSTMRCVENCASFRTFATDWIPVKETRRNYYGNTSVNQEQSTWKCLQLRYSTNTGLWLHTLRALLRLTVAISLQFSCFLIFLSIFYRTSASSVRFSYCWRNISNFISST